jgi:hypothetical protein
VHSLPPLLGSPSWLRAPARAAHMSTYPSGRSWRTRRQEIAEWQARGGARRRWLAAARSRTAMFASCGERLAIKSAGVLSVARTSVPLLTFSAHRCCPTLCGQNFHFRSSKLLAPLSHTTSQEIGHFERRSSRQAYRLCSVQSGRSRICSGAM